MVSLLLAFFLALLSLSTSTQNGWGLDNGLGLTPQMGWNSWNHFGCNTSAKQLTDTMDQFISVGLDKLGYKYVNVDDCWQCSRDSNGNIVPCPDTFPNGIKPVADYAHSLGLLFGLYSDAGEKTCAGRPGSLGHETSDANTYASWGVDYLKYDNCYNDLIPARVRYPPMRDALNQTGRAIFFSMCEWGREDPWTWAESVGNSWRTTRDIKDTWQSMLSNWDHNGVPTAAGPGGWNDPDMLEVGNGGMTNIEYTSHFSLWCIGKSPLLIGCDVSNMTQETKNILMNTEAIAVNQDPLGVQAKEVYANKSMNYQIYAGPLVGNSLAVLVFNRGTVSVSVRVEWSVLGLATNSQYVVRDLWLHSDLGTFSNYYVVDVVAHGVSFAKLTPA